MSERVGVDGGIFAARLDTLGVFTAGLSEALDAVLPDGIALAAVFDEAALAVETFEDLDADVLDAEALAADDFDEVAFAVLDAGALDGVLDARVFEAGALRAVAFGRALRPLAVREVDVERAVAARGVLVALVFLAAGLAAARLGAAVFVAVFFAAGLAEAAFAVVFRAGLPVAFARAGAGALRLDAAVFFAAADVFFVRTSAVTLGSAAFAFAAGLRVAAVLAVVGLAAPDFPVAALEAGFDADVRLVVAFAIALSCIRSTAGLVLPRRYTISVVFLFDVARGRRRGETKDKGGGAARATKKPRFHEAWTFVP